jgi:hypothetical protein
MIVRLPTSHIPTMLILWQKTGKFLRAHRERAPNC